MCVLDFFFFFLSEVVLIVSTRYLFPLFCGLCAHVSHNVPSRPTHWTLAETRPYSVIKFLHLLKRSESDVIVCNTVLH